VTAAAGPTCVPVARLDLSGWQWFARRLPTIGRLFLYPPKPELAAAARLPLLVLTILPLYRPVNSSRPAPRWAGRRGLTPLAAAPIAFAGFVLGIGLFLA
jgi:hypothetical protein